MYKRDDDPTDRPSGGAIVPGHLSTVTEWIRHGTRLDPDAPAVQDGDGCVTHLEFDTITDGVAADLRRQGVRPGDRVGLCIDRSTALVAGLVGIIKCGATYVPLDPNYPADRLEMMQQDADLTLTLVNARHRDWIAAGGAKTRVWEELAAELDDRPAARRRDDDGIAEDVDPETAVFVVFTSGSTGRPKGVEMPHRAIANLVEWQLSRPSFLPKARVLQYSSISFDVSLQEIATTLASGGHLFMVSDEERRDPRRLLSLLDELRIQRLFLPFVALRSLVEVAQHGAGLPECLTEVITAGEQLRVDDALRAAFADRPGLTLDNQYGPSETHVITAHLLGDNPSDWPDLPPIGIPVSGGAVVVLDDDRQRVVDGDVGELYLGGGNLAHGYIGRPDLTAERFVTIDGQRWYRSGDLGHRDAEGEIHFHGRADHQVKIRGHRVEPGEINAAASRMPGVTQALSHAFHRASGAPFIVTYFVTGGDSSAEPTVTPAELRHHLRANLPDYMVPAFVIRLDHIELGPSGKANLQALPDPRAAATDSLPDYATDTERRLATVWSDVLEFPNLPPDVDFLELGGDSLAAVTLFLRIAEEFDIELPLATITQAPTLRELAARIDAPNTLSDDGYRSLQVLKAGTPSAPPLVLVHGGGGNVLIFSELSSNLDAGQPVLAFQWSGWDGHRGEATIADMADAYVAELRRFAPQGPYRLGGHCIGGLIAIEMGHRLVELGAEVDGPLIVSDAPNISARSYRAEEPDSDPASAERFDAMAEELLARVPPELRTEGWRGRSHTTPVAGSATESKLDPVRATMRRYPWMLRTAKSFRTKLQVARIEATVRMGRELPMDRRLLYCTETMVRTARRHRPRAWAGDVLYFRTSTFAAKEMALEGWWDDVEMGFGELCTGRFESHVVGGRHNEPLNLPWVADRIREAFSSDAKELSDRATP